MLSNLRKYVRKGSDISIIKEKCGNEDCRLIDEKSNTIAYIYEIGENIVSINVKNNIIINANIQPKTTNIKKFIDIYFKILKDIELSNQKKS